MCRLKNNDIYFSKKKKSNDIYRKIEDIVSLEFIKGFAKGIVEQMK